MPTHLRFRPDLLTIPLLVLLGAAACGNSAPAGEPASTDEFADAGAGEAVSVQAFVGVQILDGTGAPLLENGVVVVRDGLIAEVGTADALTPPPGAEILDMEGRFLLPGFVNAHGHVGPDGDRADVGEQLEIYAHYGVTTVLSLGDEADDPREERWSPELRRARLFVSGPSLVPDSPEAAENEVARVVAMGADWVKMHVNEATNRDTYPALIGAAQRRSMPTAVHIEELEDARGVLEAGASLLAHSVRDAPVDDNLIQRMRARDVCLVPTFTRELSTWVYADRPDFFDDPFFLERSAPDDLEEFITPQRQAQAQGAGARYWREALPLAMENMVRLHDSGVGIAMGTDSGPSGRFQGYFEHLEMEMMVEAGMTPDAVLVSATGEAARCVGLEDAVGTLQPGRWADLVVLDADPREDIRNTREIHGVWIAGNRVR